MADNVAGHEHDWDGSATEESEARLGLVLAQYERGRNKLLIVFPYGPYINIL